MRRRDFLKRLSLLAAASTTSHLLLPSGAWARLTPKRVLVLGGTSFLGPALVEALLADGHKVTLFNRGVTNPELFAHLERLRGFRSPDGSDQNLSALEKRQFDTIVDVWPNDPDEVASAATFLKERAHHYVFVSSVGAYDHKEFVKGSIGEDAPLQPWNQTGRQYNRNKAESERRLHEIIRDRLTIVRPGPIKGTRDTTPDLLTWLLRMQAGGEHIAPGDGRDPVQLVDVKDVASFLATAIRQSLSGVFNLTGKTMSFREFLEASKNATNSDASLTWIPQQVLHENGLETDGELQTFAGNFPFWIPEPNSQGLYRVSSAKAFAAGWRTRSFDATAFDCLTDFYVRQTMEPSTFLSPVKEREILTAWNHRPA